ncbi:uncharacterized protein TrAtP1_000902 [Trichoderma atroviride]|uniref:uncharacterized protein n=1 Tax=Hypocrea atroviridis TaxID=63577 RepID=UPI00332079F5|nr:hypothetical protein TrAtP1_000902 [Trichoderma atroviride]
MPQAAIAGASSLGTTRYDLYYSYLLAVGQAIPSYAAAPARRPNLAFQLPTCHMAIAVRDTCDLRGGMAH